MIALKLAQTVKEQFDKNYEYFARKLFFNELVEYASSKHIAFMVWEE